VGAHWKYVLSAYRVDDATGAWSLVGFLPDLARGSLDPQGRFLVAGFHDKNASHHGITYSQTKVVTYGIDPATGALSLTSATDDYLMQGPIWLHPSRRFLLLTYDDPCSYRILGINPATGVAGDPSFWLGCDSSREANTWVAIDPLGRFLYHGSCGVWEAGLPGGSAIPSVFGYRLDLDNGGMRKVGEWAAGHCIAIDRSGHHLYSSIPDGQVAEFAIDDITGNLAALAQAPAPDTPGSLVVHPSGRLLYAAIGSDIVAYRLDAALGAPSLLRAVAMGVTEPKLFPGDPSHPAHASPTCTLTLDPAGRYLYVTRTHFGGRPYGGYGTADVLGYRVNSATGDLQPIQQAEGGRAGTVAFREFSQALWIGLAMPAR